MINIKRIYYDREANSRAFNLNTTFNPQSVEFQINSFKMYIKKGQDLSCPSFYHIPNNFHHKPPTTSHVTI